MDWSPVVLAEFEKLSREAAAGNEDYPQYLLRLTERSGMMPVKMIRKLTEDEVIVDARAVLAPQVHDHVLRALVALDDAVMATRLEVEDRDVVEQPQEVAPVVVDEVPADLVAAAERRVDLRTNIGLLQPNQLIPMIINPLMRPRTSVWRFFFA